MPAVTNRATFKDYCLDNKYTKWYFLIIDRALSRGWTKKTTQDYVECHHIVPNSIFKNNDVVCLTAREHFICHLLLTKMLVGPSKRKMMLALHRLTFGNKHNNVVYVKNAKFYENIKINCLQYFSERSQEYWDNISPEERTRMRSGENNSMFGKKQKESTKKLIGQKTKDRLKDKTKHPLYGIGHSEETKKQMSEMKKKYNAAAIKKKWYYNSITKQQKYFIQGQQPEGFVLGRG